MNKEHAWVESVHTLTHLTELMQACIYERKYYRKTGDRVAESKALEEIQALKRRRQQLKGGR